VRNGWVRFAEFFLLTGFTVAQPAFSVLSPHPDFFAAHNATAVELLTLVGVLTCGLPLVLVAVVSTVGAISTRGAQAVHSASIGCLLAVAFVAPLASVATSPAAASALLGVGFAAAAVGTWAHRRRESVRSALLLASPLALIFPAMFLGSSTLRPILFAHDAETFRGPRIESDTPVIVLVFDELPLASLVNASDEIDAERYPNFAELSRHADWFRNATTVASTTGPAIDALITGRRPTGEAALAVPRESLYTLLANGRGVLAFEPGGKRCPPDVCEIAGARNRPSQSITAFLDDVRILYLHQVVPRAWGVALPEVRMTWKGFGLPNALDETDANERPLTTEHDVAWQGFTRFAKTRDLELALRALHFGERPTLLLLHLFLPHAPWMYFPSGRTYEPAPYAHGNRDGRWVGSEWQSTQALQRHLLQVAHSDSLLGSFLAEIREAGLYESALIVVTADHGHSFQRGAHSRDIEPANFSDVLGVPFFVKRPGQRIGAVSDRNVETIDVVPTIAAALDISVPWPVDGSSLLDLSAPERPEKIVRLNRQDGGSAEVRFGTAQVAAARARTAARIRASFGSGIRGLFRVGPSAASLSLLGLDVAAAPLQTVLSPRRVELPLRAWLNDVDLRGDALPAHVIGRASSEGGAIDLAVALNGTIQAVTQTQPAAGAWLPFTALLPENSVRQGRNSIEIFEIVYERDGPELRALSEMPYSGPRAAGSSRRGFNRAAR
jgi:hypothetical protein